MTVLLTEKTETSIQTRRCADCFNCKIRVIRQAEHFKRYYHPDKWKRLWLNTRLIPAQHAKIHIRCKKSHWVDYSSNKEMVIKSWYSIFKSNFRFREDAACCPDFEGEEEEK